MVLVMFVLGAADCCAQEACRQSKQQQKHTVKGPNYGVSPMLVNPVEVTQRGEMWIKVFQPNCISSMEPFLLIALPKLRGVQIVLNLTTFSSGIDM
jgi:hypothetical protein